jgi:hypothetical protein
MRASRRDGRRSNPGTVPIPWIAADAFRVLAMTAGWIFQQFAAPSGAIFFGKGENPMQAHWTLDLIWWITAVELPALGGLYWLAWRNRRDADGALESLRRRTDAAQAALRESLSAYKLEVATSYASIPYLREVEARLTDHLIRIEAKLDRTVGIGGGAP